jgi:hypothetical protein
MHATRFLTPANSFGSSSEPSLAKPNFRTLQLRQLSRN